MAGIAGAIAGAALPLIGDALNFISTNRTNNTNWEIQQSINEQNERLYHEQQQWQEDMYNKYNSPEAMVKQYKKAGLNPNLMSGTSGNTMQSSLSLPEMRASQMVAPQLSLGGLGTAIGELLQDSELKHAQASKLSAETDAQNVENAYQQMRILHELRESRNRANLSDAQRRQIDKQIDAIEIDLGYRRETIEAQNEQSRASAELAREQSQNVRLQSKYQEQVNAVFPRLNQYQLNLLGAQTFAAAKAGLASAASANLSDEMAKREAIKRIGDVLDNGIKSGEFSLQQLGLSQAQVDAARSGDIEKARSNPVFRVFDDGVHYLSEHGGMLLGFGAGRVSRAMNRPTKVKGFK